MKLIDLQFYQIVKDVLIGLGVGIPNQLSTLFLLRAASVLPAYLVFGTFSAERGTSSLSSHSP